MTLDEAIQRENKIAEENQKIVDTQIVFRKHLQNHQVPCYIRFLQDVTSLAYVSYNYQALTSPILPTNLQSAYDILHIFYN